ncbi:hypothetical protein [Faecalibaculum rodentium]|uniref:hypothetical protein n=1 Tax=Faecalibaculum rodentium TaxID=1702221 RepID=UPI003F677300
MINTDGGQDPHKQDGDDEIPARMAAGSQDSAYTAHYINKSSQNAGEMDIYSQAVSKEGFISVLFILIPFILMHAVMF